MTICWVCSLHLNRFVVKVIGAFISMEPYSVCGIWATRLVLTRKTKWPFSIRKICLAIVNSSLNLLIKYKYFNRTEYPSTFFYLGFIQTIRKIQTSLVFKFNRFQIDWLLFWLLNDGQMLAASDILSGFTSIHWFVEGSTNSTNMQTWATVVAKEITLAISGFVKFSFSWTETFVSSFWWAFELQEGFGITVLHQIWPVALKRNHLHVSELVKPELYVRRSIISTLFNN